MQALAAASARKPQTAMTDELLTVVNHLDEPLEPLPRSKVHARGLLHRAVHVFVTTPDGLTCIQMRSAAKDTYPLHYECVGGHVNPGETYEAAARREVEEELGVTAGALVRIGKLAAYPETGHEFIEVFRTIAATPLQPNPEEVAGVLHLTVPELETHFAEHAPRYSPAVRLSLPLYLASLRRED